MITQSHANYTLEKLSVGLLQGVSESDEMKEATTRAEW